MGGRGLLGLGLGLRQSLATVFGVPTTLDYVHASMLLPFTVSGSSMHILPPRSLGVRVPGLSMTAENYTIIDVYTMLVQSCSARHEHGQVNTIGSDTSKKLETLMGLTAVVLAHE